MAHISTHSHTPFLSSVTASIVSGLGAVVEMGRNFAQALRHDARSDAEVARLELTGGKFASYVVQDERRY